MYRLLITDLDGTAIEKGAQEDDVNKHLIQLISEANSSGKIVTCATGRNWKLAKPIIRKLGMVHPCIISGGSIIIDPVTEKLIWEKKINTNDANYVLNEFRSIKSNDDVEISYSNDHRYKLNGLEDLKLTDPNYIYLIGCNISIAKSLIKTINNSSRDIVAHPTPSWGTKDKLDIHITHINGTKKDAVEVLLGIFNVSKEAVIGIGDSNNDIPLLNSVGLKMSTSKATQDLIRVSDWIAPGGAEEALIFTINRFLLNNTDPKIKVSAGGIIFHDDKCLLIKNLNNDEVALPKGTPDQTESLPETVIREVLEETGYHVKIKDYIGNSNYSFIKNKVSYKKYVFYYLLELVKPNEIPKPIFQDDENYQNLWLKYDNAEQLLTHSENKYIFNKAKLIYTIQYKNVESN